MIELELFYFYQKVRLILEYSNISFSKSFIRLRTSKVTLGGPSRLFVTGQKDIVQQYLQSKDIWILKGLMRGLQISFRTISCHQIIKYIILVSNLGYHGYCIFSYILITVYIPICQHSFVSLYLTTILESRYILCRNLI
jgi:hypothetical protein